MRAVVRAAVRRHGRGRRRWGLCSAARSNEIWDDIERFWAEEAEEPPLPEPIQLVVGERGGARRAGAAGRDRRRRVGASILLLLFGEARAALGVAVATALGWTVWHYRQQLAAWWAQTVSPTVTAAAADGA